jgi:hypothetical protein
MRDLPDQMTCWRTHRVRPWLGDVIGGVPAAILLPTMVVTWLLVGAFLGRLGAATTRSRSVARAR